MYMIWIICISKSVFSQEIFLPLNIDAALRHNSGTVVVTVRSLLETCISLWPACLAPRPLPPCLHVIVPIFQPLSSTQPETAGLLINSLIWRISLPFATRSVTCQAVCVYASAWIYVKYACVCICYRWLRQSSEVRAWGKDAGVYLFSASAFWWHYNPGTVI